MKPAPARRIVNAVAVLAVFALAVLGPRVAEGTRGTKKNARAGQVSARKGTSRVDGRTTRKLIQDYRKLTGQSTNVSVQVIPTGTPGEVSSLVTDRDTGVVSVVTSDGTMWGTRTAVGQRPPRLPTQNADGSVNKAFPNHRYFTVDVSR